MAAHDPADPTWVDVPLGEAGSGLPAPDVRASETYGSRPARSAAGQVARRAVVAAVRVAAAVCVVVAARAGWDGQVGDAIPAVVTAAALALIAHATERALDRADIDARHRDQTLEAVTGGGRVVVYRPPVGTGEADAVCSGGRLHVVVAATRYRRQLRTVDGHDAIRAAAAAADDLAGTAGVDVVALVSVPAGHDPAAVQGDGRPVAVVPVDRLQRQLGTGPDTPPVRAAIMAVAAPVR